jgi:hypothetical protein
MFNIISFIAAILIGSGLLWVAVGRTRREGQKAYQPVRVRIDDDLRRGRRGLR